MQGGVPWTSFQLGVLIGGLVLFGIGTTMAIMTYRRQPGMLKWIIGAMAAADMVFVMAWVAWVFIFA